MYSLNIYSGSTHATIITMVIIDDTIVSTITAGPAREIRTFTQGDESILIIKRWGCVKQASRGQTWTKLDIRLLARTGLLRNAY